MILMPVEVTNNYVRVRIKEPKLFIKDSFRTISLGKGIKAIVGRREGNNKTVIQSVLFDKTRYTKEQAMSWINKNRSRFATAVMMEKLKKGLFIHEFSEEVDMVSDNVTVEVTVFTDEKAVTVLKGIIEKLEKATTLEEAKAVKEELEALVPVSEDSTDEVEEKDVPKEIEEIAQESATVTEEVQSEGATVEDTKKTEVAEAKMSDVPAVETVELAKFTELEERLNSTMTQFGDVLQLNEKMITALKEAESEIDALKSVNTQLSSKVQEAESQVSVFKARVESFEHERFSTLLHDVHKRWCSVFKLVNKEKQEEAFRMLSNFNSEDKLVEMNAYLDSLEKNVETEPLIMTQHSSVFKETVQEEPDLSTMSQKERVAYLHGKYLKAAGLR